MRNVYRSPYTFSVKPKWWTVVFWFFVSHSSAEAYLRIAPSRTLYGRGYKVLWRVRGNMVACTRGVCGQPFSTPPYIYRFYSSPGRMYLYHISGYADVKFACVVISDSVTSSRYCNLIHQKKQIILNNIH